jgi:creatinine amidohydrolase
MPWTPDGEGGGAGDGSEVPTHTQLCIADEATFWPWNNWPDLANWPDKDRTLVVIPLAGMADHGLDGPLDSEETVLLSVLKLASETRPSDQPLLVLPPLRWALGPQPDCAFAIEPDTACNLLEEVAGSVAYTGFTRAVFLNASPWNEELCKAVSRDLRIHHRLQMFGINLSALGLDFHPTRGGERKALRHVLAAVAGADNAEGTAILQKTAAHLLALFAEMRDRPALAAGGEIPRQHWP